MATATSSVATTAASQQLTRWADANSTTVTGRVFNAELVNGRYGEFVSIDIITRPVQGDDDSQVVVHLNSSSLVPFFKAGGVPTGRVVTATGNFTGIESFYTDKATGEIKPLRRPRIRLGDAFVQWGPKPSSRK